jgi:hypothetical protein
VPFCAGATTAPRRDRFSEARIKETSMNSALLVLSLVGFNADAPQCKHPGIFPAKAIVKAYRDNQAYAAEFFEGGKTIQVSGRVLKMKKRPPEAGAKEAFVLLLSPDGKPAKSVHLEFVFEDENRCKLAQIFAGQYVSIKGKVKTVEEKDGYTGVQFDQCMLVD